MGQHERDVPSSRLAIVAFKLAVASIFLDLLLLLIPAIDLQQTLVAILMFAGPLAALISVALGIVAIFRAQNLHTESATRAFAGIALGSVSLVIAGMVLTPARHTNHRSSCANQEKQLGLIFKMYANESKGELWPELSSEPGRLMFANQSSDGGNPVYPDYLTDLSIMVCDSDTDREAFFAACSPWEEEFQGVAHCLDDQSYFYLGYVITNQNELEAFAAAYREHIASGKPFIDDLKVTEGNGTAGKDVIYRLRVGVERSPNDPNVSIFSESIVPVLIERIGNHTPPGGHVLYMDGHGDFVKHGEWPMTDEAMAILESLDAMGSDSGQSIQPE